MDFRVIRLTEGGPNMGTIVVAAQFLVATGSAGSGGKKVRVCAALTSDATMASVVRGRGGSWSCGGNCYLPLGLWVQLAGRSVSQAPFLHFLSFISSVHSNSSTFRRADLWMSQAS